MLNPFQFNSFLFLVFYFILGITVNWGLWIWVRRNETAALAPQITLTDPYLIAYLRNGYEEALRVATVALLDRGLLIADGDKLVARDMDAVSLVNRPIEKAILSRYLTVGDSGEIFSSSQAVAACESYGATLREQGLLAGPKIYGQRFMPMLVALGILLGVAYVRVSMAFAQGRHNVGFLVFFVILFSAAVIFTFRKRLTAAGDAMMQDLWQLFQRLNRRAGSLRAGGQTNEAALLAAVFGLAALPAAGFPFVQKLFPSKSTSDGSSCGSSSSSCGSSCGGGGGCGGGSD